MEQEWDGMLKKKKKRPICPYWRLIIMKAWSHLMHKYSKIPGTLGSVGYDHYHTRYCLIFGNMPWKSQDIFLLSTAWGHNFSNISSWRWSNPTPICPVLLSSFYLHKYLCFHEIYQTRELIVSHLPPPKRWLLIPWSSSQSSDKNTCVSGEYVVVTWAVSDVEKAVWGFSWQLMSVWSF